MPAIKLNVFCLGDHHTACILDTGVLYTFGYGSRGALGMAIFDIIYTEGMLINDILYLGHGEYKNEEFPRVVEALQHKMV